MVMKTMAFAVLALLLMASAASPFGGGGGGGVGVPIDLLMPAQPQNVTATAGNGAVTVNFAPPKNDGGSRIQYYTVTSHPDGIAVKGTKSPIVVNGLTNGRSYVFTVAAMNSVGTGLASCPSNSVTPGE